MPSTNKKHRAFYNMFIAWGYTTGTFHRKPRETTSSMLEYLRSQTAYRQIGFHEVLEYHS